MWICRQWKWLLVKRTLVLFSGWLMQQIWWGNYTVTVHNKCRKSNVPSNSAHTHTHTTLRPCLLPSHSLKEDNLTWGVAADLILPVQFPPQDKHIRVPLSLSTLSLHTMLDESTLFITARNQVTSIWFIDSRRYYRTVECIFCFLHVLVK